MVVLRNSRSEAGCAQRNTRFLARNNFRCRGGIWLRLTVGIDRDATSAAHSSSPFLEKIYEYQVYIYFFLRVHDITTYLVPGTR